MNILMDNSLYDFNLSPDKRDIQFKEENRVVW